jgi:signal peptidase I
VTAGEHSGRGYGRDDQGYPSQYEQVGGYDGNAGDPWGGTGSWQQPPQWPTTPSWPDQAAGPDHPADQYGGQDQWRYAGQVPADQYGYQAGYGDAHTQAFTRPADGYGSADWSGPAPAAAAWQEAGDPDHDSGSGRRGRGLPLWQELPLLLIIAFCLAILVRTFLLQAFFIPSGSMEDTLLAGDRVLVNKIVYNFREPARGEVVVFNGTDAWAPQHSIDTDIGTFAKIGRTLGDLVGIKHPDDKDFIKRVVGLPGDRISCCDVDGRIFVNGQPIDEDYVIHNAPLTDSPERTQDCRNRRFDEMVVEPGQLFVLGDHRAVSQDSRCQGQVPVDNVIGRAFVIVWPSSRWTGLSAPETFDSVPRAGEHQHVVVADPQPSELVVVVPALLLAAAGLRRLRRVSGSPATGETVGSRGG